MTNTALEAMVKLGKFLFDFGFIFFPSIGFIHQYIKIKRLKSSYGFSKLISLILFIAFIFRVFFWIGKRFDMVILFQSIVGIVMQLFLIKACIEYSEDNKYKSYSDIFNLEEFWNWPFFLDYFYFILFLVIFISLLSNLIGFENMIYVEFLGGVSAFVETMLGLPQIWENYKTKNVKTLSYLMICCWLLGDAIKTFYYVQSESPFQLTLSGVGQLCGDFVICFQIFYYTKIYKKKKIHSDNVEIM